AAKTLLRMFASISIPISAAYLRRRSASARLSMKTPNGTLSLLVSPVIGGVVRGFASVNLLSPFCPGFAASTELAEDSGTSVLLSSDCDMGNSIFEIVVHTFPTMKQAQTTEIERQICPKYLHDRA